MPYGASGGSSKPCTGGPRLASGKCPPRPCKYGRSKETGYCNKAPSSGPRGGGTSYREQGLTPTEARAEAKAKRERTYVQSRVEKTATTAITNALLKPQPATKTFVKKVADYLNSPIGGGAGAGAVGWAAKSRAVVKAAAPKLGLAAFAGIASYYITSKIIQKRASNKEQRSIQARQIAEAYRLSRLEAAKQKGAALTAMEQRQLADQFRKIAKDAGIPVGTRL